ncbi:MAG TPA: hypothetical protein PKK43_15820, partial [Spirochaetota bacterium]|nr:hypothetical protein [Spirochaetota bacterium]
MKRVFIIIPVLLFAMGLIAEGKTNPAEKKETTGAAPNSAWTTGKHVNAFTANGIASEKDVNA